MRRDRHGTPIDKVLRNHSVTFQERPEVVSQEGNETRQQNGLSTRYQLQRSRLRLEYYYREQEQQKIYA